jgi:lipopolysaccharide/colanic/teichoic acid biosynthesis glycosyltransferase
MSLVGPRPLRIEDFDGLKHVVGLYMSVRPGLTGLWFVSDERSLGDVALNRLDRVYIKTGTFLMDITILLRTPFVFLRLA